MEEYFRTLNAIDPLFHALVVSKLREVEEREGLYAASIDDLTEADELDVLRQYCPTLFKEYRTLRTILLENMQVSGKAVRLKHTTN